MKCPMQPHLTQDGKPMDRQSRGHAVGVFNLRQTGVKAASKGTPVIGLVTCCVTDVTISTYNADYAGWKNKSKPVETHLSTDLKKGHGQDQTAATNAKVSPRN